MNKLVETDQRKEEIHNEKKHKKHFNSFFTGQKEKDRVYNENYTMVMRMRRL